MYPHKMKHDSKETISRSTLPTNRHTLNIGRKYINGQEKKNILSTPVSQSRAEMAYRYGLKNSSPQQLAITMKVRHREPKDKISFAVTAATRNLYRPPLHQTKYFIALNHNFNNPHKSLCFAYFVVFFR